MLHSQPPVAQRVLLIMITDVHSMSLFLCNFYSYRYSMTPSGHPLATKKALTHISLVSEIKLDNECVVLCYTLYCRYTYSVQLNLAMGQKIWHQ